MGFFDNQFAEIEKRVKNGDIEGAADVMAHAAIEGSTGKDINEGIAGLAAAAERSGRRGSSGKSGK